MNSLKINIKLITDHSPFFSYEVTGDETSRAFFIAKGMSQLLKKQKASQIFKLGHRELDFYLRKNPRTPSFLMEEIPLINSLYEKFSLELFDYFKERMEKKHKLYHQYMASELAINIFCFREGIISSDIQLIGLEEELVIVSLGEELASGSVILEKLMDHFIKLFQDDKINVIPE